MLKKANILLVNTNCSANYLYLLVSPACFIVLNKVNRDHIYCLYCRILFLYCNFVRKFYPFHVKMRFVTKIFKQSAHLLHNLYDYDWKICFCHIILQKCDIFWSLIMKYSVARLLIPSFYNKTARIF